MAPFPRSRSLALRQGPKAPPLLPGLGLQRYKRVIGEILPVSPSSARANHLSIHISAAGVNPSQCSTILVFAPRHHCHTLPKHEICQSLFSPCAPRLAAFRRVDFSQSNSNLTVVWGQKREGVAICDADNPTRQLCCPS